LTAVEGDPVLYRAWLCRCSETMRSSFRDFASQATIALERTGRQRQYRETQSELARGRPPYSCSDVSFRTGTILYPLFWGDRDRFRGNPRQRGPLNDPRTVGPAGSRRRPGATKILFAYIFSTRSPHLGGEKLEVSRPARGLSAPPPCSRNPIPSRASLLDPLPLSGDRRGARL
jgi:hypothetical protein